MPKAIHRIRRGSPVALEKDRDKRDHEAESVSYTHLTLPTKA